MAAGITFAIQAALLLPRTGVIGGKKVLSSPTMWSALTSGSASAVEMEDGATTIDELFQITVDVNEARVRSTAAVAGAVWMGTQLWFYNKLRMAERLVAATEIFNEIRSQASALERFTKAGATADATRTKNTIEELAKTADFLTDATMMADDIKQIQIGTVRLSTTIQDLINTEPLLIKNKNLLKVASDLFDPSDLLGIKPLTEGMIKATKAPSAAVAVKRLAPKFQSIATAAKASTELAGTASWIGRIGTGIKIAGGKILLVDSIIWAVTLGLDLGLNLLGLTEEQQENLPIIGFLFRGAGWSPLGEALEWVFVNTAEAILGRENVQNLKDMLISTLIAASQLPLIEDALELILGFYINEINAELLAPLTFEGLDLAFENWALNPFTYIRADPIVILEWAIYAIVIKLVVSQWLIPVFHYLRQSSS